ncbi:MAG TPA: ATP-binding protein [Candidatus Saccharimonadales bacterium]|nr:ATP-binding protein [Candidatus Saccharimonadales bacterium]
MDLLQQLRRKIRSYVFGALLLENLILIGAWYGLAQFTSLRLPVIALTSLGVSLVGTLLITHVAADWLIQPLKVFWDAIQRLGDGSRDAAVPDAKDLHLGRELVVSLTAQIYQLASVAAKTTTAAEQRSGQPAQNFIAQNLPLPLILLDAGETITFANPAAARYVGLSAEEMQGKNVYMVLDMSFPSEDTFDSWLKTAKANSATAVSSWERVRLNVRDNHPARFFDLAAYYNRGNPDNVETMLTLFDHTKQYSQEDQAVSFIALTVHELRTPLTLLRGYIEVFEEELGGNISPELQDFMLKMRAQAEQLMAFVNNILNVARVDDDQLELRLEEANWPTILKAAIQSLSLQAKVRGITLHCRIATDLPAVGVDRLSIQEVVNNLVDNAIKYSGTSKTINIDAHLTQDGLVETTVQDFGLGISTAIMPNLFSKFYRDHRNRAQVGGTGLGLYLSKAIVNAHGGNLWVRSREGEGSTFGFTLVPYAQLAEEKKRSGNQEIARTAHGWIKNHSLYRR